MSLHISNDRPDRPPITELYIFIGVDNKTGLEGIIMTAPFPLIKSDTNFPDYVIEMLKEMSKQLNVTVKMCRFSNREEIKNLSATEGMN